MPPLPCSCFCLLSPPADLPHPHFTRLFLTRIFRHLPFPPLPGKQEKTRQNQEALLLFLPYSRIVYTGVVAEVKGWAESAIHYRHSLQQNTPHRPPTMGSHETGRCSSRLVATAALVWDPGGEVVEGEAGMRDEPPGFLWSPRNAGNREGKGWRCGSKTKPKIYVPGKILESYLTDSLNYK